MCRCWFFLARNLLQISLLRCIAAPHCGSRYLVLLSCHAAFTPAIISLPIAISSSRDTVVNWQRGLMNGRQINNRLPLLFPFLPGLPVPALMNASLPPVIRRTSSTDSSARENQPVDVSAGSSITTGWLCALLCSAAFSTHGVIAE